MGRHRRLAGFVAVLLLSMFLSRTWAESEASEGEGVDIPQVLMAESPPPPQACWVFNHLNKAGGSTVKYMMMPWIEKYNVSLGLYDSAQWGFGPEYARKFIQDNYTVTWGAYTEGLRPYGAQECKWFTIFRHPIDRLVSAYFYCKKSPVDGMCGSRVLRADEVDLVTFAKHWGNFGLRQFLYAGVSVEDVIASEASDPQVLATNRYPSWWRVKRYHENRAVNGSSVAAAAAKSAEGFISIEYTLLKDFLAPVKKLLSDRYSAVGMIEDWSTTLRLFNSALRIPGFDWETAHHQIGTKNINHEFLEEAERALRFAREDPDINEFIRLDLLLYEHAREVHTKQVAEYRVGDL